MTIEINQTIVSTFICPFITITFILTRPVGLASHPACFSLLFLNKNKNKTKQNKKKKTNKQTNKQKPVVCLLQFSKCKRDTLWKFCDDL